MKKAIIIFSGVVLFLVILLFLVPALFKKKGLEILDETIKDNVNADVIYNPESFSIELFTHFPNPTVSVKGIGVINREPFEGDTLAAMDHLKITLDLFSVIGGQLRVKSIDIARPRFNIRILEDGRSNYDIAIAVDSLSEEVEPAQEEGFSLGIDSWTVTDGAVYYEDMTMPMVVILEGVQHKGRGDFTQEVFDMVTENSIRKAAITYDGIPWINGQQMRGNITLNINLPEEKYTFGENQVWINDLLIMFKGQIIYAPDHMDIDISYASQEASIKSLYSLIPAVYTEGYENIQAAGELVLDGHVRGRYSEEESPDFSLDLKTDNGTIQYPDLPTPITDIAIDMHAFSQDGDYDQVTIDIKRLKLMLGRNPINARLLIKNLVDYDMEADIQAKIELADLMSVFPMEGIDLSGQFDLRLKAAGIFDSSRNIMPSIDAVMQMTNGSIVSDTLPAALDQIYFTTWLKSPDGSMKSGTLKVDDLSFRMGQDRFKISLLLSDFTDYVWDMIATGSLDLGILSAYYSVDNTTYEGKVSGSIQTKGRYSDLESGRYSQIPTSGELELSGLRFVNPDFPGGVAIDRGMVSLSPSTLIVSSLSGNIGQSDFQMNGAVTGYLEYMLQEHAVIEGKMSLKSDIVDLNEWMTGEETPKGGYQEDTVKLEAFEIPANIDFSFDSKIATLYYDNLTLKNVTGDLQVKNGRLNMKDLSFDLLGGRVGMNGVFDASEPERPIFNYNLNLSQLSIPEAFAKFNTVRVFAPVAQYAVGNFSSLFSISGALTNRLKPIYPSLNGLGSIEVREASVKESKLVSGISQLTNYQFSTSNISLSDVILSASIEQGRSYVKPFSIKMGDHKAMISGSIGADGILDYKVTTDLKAGALGQQLNSLIAGIGKKGTDPSSDVIPVTFKVTGNYTNPKIALENALSGDKSIGESATEVISEGGATIQDEAGKEIEKGKQHILEGDTAALRQQADSLKKTIENLEKSGENVKGLIENLFKKKEKKDNPGQ